MKGNDSGGRNALPSQFRPSWLPTRKQNTASWSADYARRNSRPPAAQRGYDRDWFALRAQMLRDEPMCRVCAALGIERGATMVDHTVPIRHAPERRLDPANLVPMCDYHHRLKTNRHDGGFGKRRR